MKSQLSQSSPIYDGPHAALCYSSRFHTGPFRLRAPSPCTEHTPNPNITCTALECLITVQTGDILFTISRAIRWNKSLLSSFLCPTCAWDCLPHCRVCCLLQVTTCLSIPSNIGDGGDNESPNMGPSRL